jgi:hypothetical protein
MAKSPLSNAQANRLIKMYDSGEKDILKEINRLLLKADKPEYSLAWQKTLLGRVRQIRRDLLAGSRTWCQQAIPATYIEGFKWADADALAGKRVIAGFGAIHQQAVQVLAENAYSRLASVDQVVGRNVDDIFRKVSLENVRGSVMGYETTAKAAQNIRQDLAERGITGFVDKAGHEWDMGRYSEMLAQETTNQSFRAGSANRYQEHDHDLVQISQHEDACDLCDPFQGETFSMSGQDEEFPPIQDAIDEGLFHVGCLHVLNLAPEEKERFLGTLAGDQGEEARRVEIDRLAAAYEGE